MEMIEIFPPIQAHKTERINTLQGEVREGRGRKGVP
jgi:hypothetical protein